MRESSCSYELELDNQFFADLDAPEIQKGHLRCQVTVKKGTGVYTLAFHTEGVVVVLCDRCLDEMEQLITSDDTLKVKLGLSFSDEDDFVIVPEGDGYINVAWFIYEFIALAIPMKHVHAPGKCNKGMMGKLSEYSRVMEGDEDSENFSGDDSFATETSESDEIDPRWNELKKILNNNN